MKFKHAVIPRILAVFVAVALLIVRFNGPGCPWRSGYQL